MRIREIEPAFRPAWWLPGPHAQTLWPYLFRRLPRGTYTKERLELPDGDFVDLSWTGGGDGAIVVVFHGLEGCIDSPYAAGIMAAITKSGWRGVFMHFRGCSGIPNRLARSYHSGDTGDIGFLIQTLRQRFPHAPVAAVGYSLGGNALLKYLGEKGNNTELDAAVAVSVPFLLANGARKLETGFSRIYQWHLIKRLHRKIVNKFKHVAPTVSIDDVSDMNTFYKFDNHITAPLHGFRDVEDYYEQSSSRQFLKHIRRPTLILHAADDPFMTPEAIPDESELSKEIKLEVSTGGGHVGFISGNYPWQPVYWLEKRIPDFFRSVISK